MAEIIKISDRMPNSVAVTGDKVAIIGLDDIRRLASGELSIAEFEDPELAAQALAVMVIGFINDN